MLNKLNFLTFTPIKFSVCIHKIESESILYQLFQKNLIFFFLFSRVSVLDSKNLKILK